VVGAIGKDCQCKLYADDLKIYCKIKTQQDEDLLQGSLDALTRWLRDWQLTISTKKCAIHNIHRKPTVPSRDYTLAKCLIPTHDAVKDHGVMVDSDLKFPLHINIAARAHSRANLIHKCFVSKDRDSFLRAYIKYVRPLLEYASQAWSLTSTSLKQYRDASQSTWMEWVAWITISAKSTSYRQFAKASNPCWPYFTFKVLFGPNDMNSSEFLTLNSNYRKKRKLNPYKLHISYCKVDTRNTSWY